MMTRWSSAASGFSPPSLATPFKGRTVPVKVPELTLIGFTWVTHTFLSLLIYMRMNEMLLLARSDPRDHLRIVKIKFIPY